MCVRKRARRGSRICLEQSGQRRAGRAELAGGACYGRGWVGRWGGGGNSISITDGVVLGLSGWTLLSLSLAGPCVMWGVAEGVRPLLLPCDRRQRRRVVVWTAAMRHGCTATTHCLAVVVLVEGGVRSVCMMIQT